MAVPVCDPNMTLRVTGAAAGGTARYHRCCRRPGGTTRLLVECAFANRDGGKSWYAPPRVTLLADRNMFACCVWGRVKNLRWLATRTKFGSVVATPAIFNSGGREMSWTFPVVQAFQRLLPGNCQWQKLRRS